MKASQRRIPPDRIKSGRIHLRNQSTATVHNSNTVMEEYRTRGGRNETALRVRGGCARVPVLACCYFVLSIGVLRWSTAEASSKGARFLSPSAARNHPSVPLTLFSRLDGQRGDEGEGSWPIRRFRRSPTAESVMSPPAMATLLESVGEVPETTSNVASGSPWALIAFREYPGGKRHSLSFTPRLGRESGEEKEEDTILEVEEEEEDEEDEDAIGREGIFHKRRTPPFAPRLGRRSEASRRVIPFSPRLGRRWLRSDAGGDEVPSPATGDPSRNLIFSPRLGRSTKQADGPRSDAGDTTDDVGNKDA